MADPATEATAEVEITYEEKLDLLELGASATAAPELIADVAGERPTLIVDITDPPTPPRAVVGDLEVTGKDADDAMTKLGAELARGIRADEAAAVDAKAAKVP
jgi:hypothetical protein